MTNTELRIGNYVKAQEKYRKVKSMYVDGSVGLDNGFTYSMDLISPIPLTTEILKQCGFLKLQDGDMAYPEIWFIIYQHVLVTHQLTLQSRDEGEWHWLEGNTNVELNSLHCLQNLFHALSQGQELNIEL